MSKTYFLCNDGFDTPPDGPIRLGHLITDLNYPSSSLNETSRITPDSPVSESWKGGFKATRSELRAGNLGIWAKLLELSPFGVSAKVHWDRSSDDIYNIDKIDTAFFTPSRAYLEKSLAIPEVKEYLAAARWRKNLYMVTGVKIARGASMTRVKTHGRGGELELGVSGAAAGLPASVGSQAGLNRQNSESLSFEESSDFVFAYRLRKVLYKGKTPVSEPYSTGTMMGADDKEKGEGPQAELLGTDGISEHDVSAGEFKSASKDAKEEKGDDPDETFVLIQNK